MKKDQLSSLAVSTLILIVVVAVFGALFSSRSDEFIPVADEIIVTLFTIAIDVLYILGGGLIIFGSVLITVRFIKAKLRDPCQPSGVLRYLTGYLTLSLEIFIGAEILNTTITRTMEHVILLMLTILARALISLILLAEQKWGSHEEQEKVCNV